jgi:MSHA biogenesis protein MshP
MTPHFTPPHGRPRGFAIVSAIFILVVLAALGAFIVSVTTSQQIGSTLDFQGVRAYQAARAGIEWGIYQVQSSAGYNFGYASTNTNNRACPASPASFTPAAPTFATFTVTVTCAATVDANNGPTVYSLVATACNQPAAGACPNLAPAAGFNYIERRIDAAL